jgi:hypothetical protein
MAKKYKKLEDEGKILKPTHKEQMILNEEHQFVGYADDFLIDEQKGNWCLGENKTVAQTSIFGLHKVMNSFQTALYLEMCGPFLSKFYMSKKDVRCVEVREILVPSIKPLKGRGKNAIPEDDTQFFDRCFEKIQINAMQGLPTEETRKRALITFQKVKEAIDFNRDNEERYHCNHDMCFGFWGRKPCPFVLHCHPHLEVKFTEDDDDIDFDF